MTQHDQTLAEFLVSNSLELPKSVYSNNQVDEAKKQLHIKRIDNFLEALYGRKTTSRDWFFNDTLDKNVQIKIKKARLVKKYNQDGEKTDPQLSLVLEAYDTRTGDKITSAFQRTVRKSKEGGVDIHNHTLCKSEDYNGDIKIGSVVNSSQVSCVNKLNKTQTGKINEGKNTISICAQSSSSMIGANYWALQGNPPFKFIDDDELKKVRKHFQTFLKKRGVNLTDKQMELFEEPCDFAVADFGNKEVIKKDINFKLSDSQISSKSLTGNKDDLQDNKNFRLSEEEIKKGLTNKRVASEGEAFFSDFSWQGEYNKNPNCRAMKFANATRVIKNKLKEKNSLSLQNKLKSKAIHAKLIER